MTNNNIEQRFISDAGKIVTEELLQSMKTVADWAQTLKSTLTTEAQRKVLDEYTEAVNALNDVEAKILFEEGFNSAMKSIEKEAI